MCQFRPLAVVHYLKVAVDKCTEYDNDDNDDGQFTNVNASQDTSMIQKMLEVGFYSTRGRVFIPLGDEVLFH